MRRKDGKAQRKTRLVSSTAASLGPMPGVLVDLSNKQERIDSTQWSENNSNLPAFPQASQSLTIGLT
jgi:hypothetical protein